MAATTTKVPDDLRYTKDHEWVRLDGNRATVGITDYAQDALTDVVYAELPDAGEDFTAGDSMGAVESVKSVSDIYSPLSGKVVDVNSALNDSPELLNTDPYGEGWFCVMEISNPAELDGLMDAASYRKVLESQ